MKETFLAGLVMVVLATRYTIKGAIKIHEDRKTIFQPSGHCFILLKYYTLLLIIYINNIKKITSKSTTQVSHYKQSL